MTPKQMAAATRRELAELSPQTKAELLAWINNRMFVVIERSDAGPRGDPEIAANAARQTIREFRELLKTALQPAPDAHLGATED